LATITNRPSEHRTLLVEVLRRYSNRSDLVRIMIDVTRRVDEDQTDEPGIPTIGRLVGSVKSQSARRLGPTEDSGAVGEGPYALAMTSLFEFAFARLDRAGSRREEFGDVWADYIAGHPWWVELNEVAERTVEVIVKVGEPAPAALEEVS
jgi:hypothetical protein